MIKVAIASLVGALMLLGVAAEKEFAGMAMMEIERMGVLPRQGGSENLQTFTGTLGGAADPITRTGDTREPFAVDGATFADLSDAVTRSCNNQHNTCARLANAQAAGGGTVADCDAQQSSCIAAGGTSIAAGANSTASEAASATSTTPSEVVVTSTSTATSGSVVVVTVGTTATATATLEGSDENFFFFCDA